MVATNEKLLCFVGHTNLLFLAVCTLRLGGVGMILSSVERQQQHLFNTLKVDKSGAQGHAAVLQRDPEEECRWEVALIWSLKHRSDLEGGQ